MGIKLFAARSAARCVVFCCVAAIGCGGGTSDLPSEATIAVDSGPDTSVHLAVTGGSGGTGGSSGTGGSGGAPNVGDATLVDAPSCTPASVDTFKPAWAPPRAPILACTKEQIESLYLKCDYGSPLYNRTACRNFETDPANKACEDCMFSVDGDATFGAIVILASGSWWSNYGGCLAMIDGDATATGCGAKSWARTECRDTACIGCSGQGWSDCLTAATRTVCSSYVRATVCEQRPSYALCNYPTWKEQFIGYGAMFCSAGLEGGVPSDAATDSGAPASDAGRDGSDF